MCIYYYLVLLKSLTQCSCVIIKTYGNTVTIIQLYNLVKLGKRKDKYTTQFCKSGSPFQNIFWPSAPSPYEFLSPLYKRAEDALRYPQISA